MLKTEALSGETPETMLKLAKMYEDGDGVERDWQKAVEFYDKYIGSIEPNFGERENDDVGLLNAYDAKGRLLRDHGILSTAREVFSKFTALCERMVLKYGVQYKRNLATGYEQLGGTCEVQGDLAGAKEYYLKSLEIRESLADSSDSLEDRRELSISYDKLGDLYDKGTEIEQSDEQADAIAAARMNRASTYDSLNNSESGYGTVVPLLISDNSDSSSVPNPREDKKPVKVKVTKFNKVDFSVITYETVKPGYDSYIDVFMYTKSQRHIVNKALQNAAEKKTEATRSMTQTSVKQGSSVTVLLTSDDVDIENDSETMIWSGDALDFKFRFSVPETYKKKAVSFACNILFDGIHITRLYFSVKLNSAKSVPVRFVRKDSRKAFVSYSHKDKQRVVDRLIAIQEVAPRIRFWMDNQSMNAGEVWRKEIASAIRSSDAFLLFWSLNSKASSEVEKEWRYALELEKKKSRRRNGSRFITPVPLDKPSECPPPDELSNLHFGDPSFDADVERIEDVRFVVNRAKPRNIRFLG